MDVPGDNGEAALFIRVARKSVKNPNKTTPFQRSTFYTSAKIFPGELRAVLINHCTDTTLEFIEFLNTPMSYTRTTSTPQLRMFFSCISPYIHDLKDKKGAWMSCSEGLQRPIIQNVQRVFSDCNPAQPEVLVAGWAANPTSRTIQKRGRGFLRDDFEQKSIIVVMKELLNLSRKEQFLLPRSTATKKGKSSRVGNNVEYEEDDYPNSEVHFDEKSRHVT